MPFAAVVDIVASRRQQFCHVLRIYGQLWLGGRERASCGQGAGHAVLRRIEAGEERAAAGRTHGAVAKGTSEGKAAVGEPLAVGQVAFRPTLRPILWLAFLVGHDEDNIGACRQGGMAAGNRWSWTHIGARSYARYQERACSAQTGAPGQILSDIGKWLSHLGFHETLSRCDKEEQRLGGAF
jgi:hypothetical protein